MCNDAEMLEQPDLSTDFGRLRWAREQAGYASAGDFAKEARVNSVTYRAHENGQNGFSRHAAQYAAKLGVTSDWLLGGGATPRVPISASPTIRSEVIPEFPVPQPRSEPTKPLPVVGSAIGIKYFDPDQHVELTELDFAEVLDYVDRPKSLLGDPKAYVVTTVGDSMWPRFRPGRRLYVSPRAPVSIGDDVVVQLRGEEGIFRDRVTTVLIKELVRRSASFIELRQFNPDVTFSMPAQQVALMHKVLGSVPE